MEWCVAQCKELMTHGVPSIHFYTMGAANSIRRIAEKKKKKKDNEIQRGSRATGNLQEASYAG